MLIDFQKYLDQKRQDLSYRSELINKIFEYHDCDPADKNSGSLYLDHVKNGFPVHILENIVARLEKKASNQQAIVMEFLLCPLLESDSDVILESKVG